MAFDSCVELLDDKGLENSNVSFDKFHNFKNEPRACAMEQRQLKTSNARQPSLTYISIFRSHLISLTEEHKEKIINWFPISLLPWPIVSKDSHPTVGIRSIDEIWTRKCCLLSVMSTLIFYFYFYLREEEEWSQKQRGCSWGVKFFRATVGAVLWITDLNLHTLCHVILLSLSPEPECNSPHLILGPAMRLALANGIWVEMTVYQIQA